MKLQDIKSARATGTVQFPPTSRPRAAFHGRNVNDDGHEGTFGKKKAGYASASHYGNHNCNSCRESACYIPRSELMRACKLGTFMMFISTIFISRKTT